MISEKEEQLPQSNEFKENEDEKEFYGDKEEQFGIHNFGEVRNEINESLLSEKQHEISEFDDLNEHQN